MKQYLLLVLIAISTASRAQLAAKPDTNANNLVQALLGPGLTYSGAKLTCAKGASGSFTYTGPGLSFSQGVLLTTGQMANAAAPASSANDVWNNKLNKVGDPDLNTLSSGSSKRYDACTLEFDFVPQGDSVNFRYQWASEEYPDYVCSNYNDVFGFFVTGPNPLGGQYASKNVAIIPGTNLPVSINSVNPGTPGQYASLGTCVNANQSLAYANYYINNFSNPYILYNGMTTPLTAKISVTPCSSYHIKLGLQDLGDGIFDSGVFFEAGSFSSNSVKLDAVSVIGSGFPTLVEGCVDGYFKFTLPSPALANTTLSYGIGGSATNGADYANLTGTINIPKDSTSANLYINPINDGIAEGQEKVVIYLYNQCIGTAIDSAVIPIADTLPVTSVITPSSCTSPTGSVDITTPYASQYYAYKWSNNTTRQDIANVMPGTYTVTITLLNGCSIVKSYVVPSQSSLPATLSVVSAGCSAKATATVNVAAGTPPYSYVWSSGASNTNVVSGLTASNIAVTVTDANNCTATATSAISYAGGSTDASFSFAGNLCLGNALSLSSTGTNTAPYTESWSLGDGTSAGNVSSVAKTYAAAGTYQVTHIVSKGSSCSDTVVKAISVYPNPLLSFTTANVLCNGTNTGNIDLSVSSGTANFAYKWNDGAIIEDRANIAAGTYQVTVSDIHACSATATASITQAATIQFNAPILSSVKCNAGNDGSITSQATGGTYPLTYIWSHNAGLNSSTASGLTAGNYAVTVKDANNCVLSKSFTITAPAPITLSTISATNIKCNGGNNGAINSSAAGGIGSLYYSWSHNATLHTANAANLTAGSYTLVVSDANNCSVSKTTIITEPAAMSFNAPTVANVKCNGGKDGAIACAVIGGTNPVTYSWSHNAGLNASSVSNLPAANYTEYVVDGNGCKDSLIFVIAQPAPLVFSQALITNPTCAGTNNGAIVAQTTGGTGSATYKWSHNPSLNSFTASNLAGGNYFVVAIDANGCKDTAHYTITSPQPLALVQQNITNVKCNGGNDGQIVNIMTGGVAPLKYKWSQNNSLNASTASGLTAGTYTQTITDANNCSTVNTFAISQPAPIVSIQPAVTNIRCFGGNDGKIISTMTGGANPLTYSWSHNALLNSNTATGLTSGMYKQIVTDAHGCKDSAIFNITEPSSIYLTVNATDEKCAGNTNGTITATTSGGTANYIFTLALGVNKFVPNAVGKFVDLAPGTYNVQVKDGNGCVETKTAIVHDAKPDDFSVKTQSLSCYGSTAKDGELHIDVLSYQNAPYWFSLDNGPVTQNTDFVKLGVGSHKVKAINANGCDASFAFDITEPAPAKLTITPIDTTVEMEQQVQLNVDLEPYGKSAITRFEWTPNSTLSCEDCANPIVSTNIPYNKYPLSVVYNHGCIATAEAIVRVKGEGSLFIPNAFTPNGDGSNDYFEVFAKHVKTMNYKIFNRWGEKVFEGESVNDKWDGTYKGEMQPVGVYILEADAAFLDGKNDHKKGSITMIR